MAGQPRMVAGRSLARRQPARRGSRERRVTEPYVCAAAEMVDLVIRRARTARERNRSAGRDEPVPLARCSPPHWCRRPGWRVPWLQRAVGQTDDLTGFALAGNKARKLERLIGAAHAASADTLVTGGGPASNFCAAAAAAARVAGMRCMLVLYGDELHPHPNLAFARWHGADVRFTGDPDRTSVDAALDRVAAEVRSRGGRPYLVPRGGASVDGAAAYVEAGDELARQLDVARARPITMLVAAGPAAPPRPRCGRRRSRRPWRVVAAAVSRPPGETATRVLTLAQGIAERLGLQPANVSDVDVRDARGPGYGIPSEEGEQATQLAAATEGLLLDPVFTAKALGLLLAAQELPGPVVFWHTGGQVAALAHLVRTLPRGDGDMSRVRGPPRKHRRPSWLTPDSRSRSPMPRCCTAGWGSPIWRTCSTCAPARSYPTNRCAPCCALPSSLCGSRRRSSRTIPRSARSTTAANAGSSSCWATTPAGCMRAGPAARPHGSRCGSLCAPKWPNSPRMPPGSLPLSRP